MKLTAAGEATSPSARLVPEGLGRKAVALLAACSVILASGPTWAVNLAAPPSLKLVAVPEPTNLGLFLKSDPNTLNADGFPVVTFEARRAAVALGKALFWDMQVGSDGVQACASCHFHAGADNRTVNQLSPGLNGGDNTFQVNGPNGTLTPGMFPFTNFVDVENQLSFMTNSKNDVVSSQGVHNSNFTSVVIGKALENKTNVADPVFNVGGVNTRRVEPRNTPTVINAVFNFTQFWDGRANNVFNGSTPFGDSDPTAGIYVNTGTTVAKQRIRIPMSSLASQAVGPPTSNFEMSFAGRTFPNIGRKLFNLKPLNQQKVAGDDSVLGPFSLTVTSTPVYQPIKTPPYTVSSISGLATGTGIPGTGPKPGLNTVYPALIQNAFQEKYWNSNKIVNYATNPPSIQNPPTSGFNLTATQFTHMEANFALFFGLAIQMYEATLVSDDSPYDRFQEGNDFAMSEEAQSGLNVFMTDVDIATAGASCFACHGTPLFTNATIAHVGVTNFGASLPEALMENMEMGLLTGAFYDAGFYNVATRPFEEDLGRAGTDPFGYPLSFTKRAIMVKQGIVLPFPNPPLPCATVNSPPACPAEYRTALNGNFKVPTLRNVELTGPYFHNGGISTLRGVVDHYVRGGSFRDHNIANVSLEINTIIGLIGNEPAKTVLVDFLLALTDDRVRFEQAPFDHPEIIVPNGAVGSTTSVTVCSGRACDSNMTIPAVGRDGIFGIGASGLPLTPFLDLNPYQP